jgi:hypothetical protein
MDVLNKVVKTSRLSADRCLVAMLLLVGSVLDLQRGRKQTDVNNTVSKWTKS